jgi:hypothetical protein
MTIIFPSSYNSKSVDLYYFFSAKDKSHHSIRRLYTILFLWLLEDHARGPLSGLERGLTKIKRRDLLEDILAMASSKSTPKFGFSKGKVLSIKT